MSYEIEQLKTMLVAGIDVYTSNEEEVSGKGSIPALWNRFFSENIVSQIPGRVNDYRIIAGYADIETDENGPYRFFIGIEVSDFENIPDDFFKLEIPEATYAKWITDSGPFSTVGINCWQNIWSDLSLKKKRTYSVDLEIYDQRSMDPENVQFAIYVGIN